MLSISNVVYNDLQLRIKKMIERSIKFYEVEVKSKDLDKLLIDHAIKEISKDPQDIDMQFNPTVKRDSYGGYTVYIKKN